jgi:hypothetical protein
MALPGLNFHPGLGVQEAVHHRFGQPVNFFSIHGMKEFFLLILVGRCKFNLSEFNVGLILQATLGGYAADFRPQRISDRCSNLWYHPRMWVFMSISCAPSPVTNIKSSSTYGVMRVQSGCLSIEISLNRKKRIGLLWSRRNSKEFPVLMHRWLKKSGFLSGANATPLGQSSNSDLAPVKRNSVFNRIKWPRDPHFRANVKHLNQAANSNLGFAKRSSVFSHIKWPRNLHRGMTFLPNSGF